MDHTILDRAILKGVHLSDADLSNSQAIGANFSGSTAIRTLFRGASFSGVSFDNAILTQADFNSAVFLKAREDMDGKRKTCGLVNVQAIGAGFQACFFEEAILDGGDFSGGNFQGADLKKSSLKQGRFIGCIFTSADLSGSTMDGTKLISCQAEFANFRNLEQSIKKPMEPYSARWAGLFCDRRKSEENRCKECERLCFADSNVKECDFTSAMLTLANFTESSATGTRFVKAILTGACMELVDLSNAILSTDESPLSAWSTNADLLQDGPGSAIVTDESRACRAWNQFRIKCLHSKRDQNGHSWSQALLKNSVMCNTQIARTEIREVSIKNFLKNNLKCVYGDDNIAIGDVWRILKLNFESLGLYRESSLAFINERNERKFRNKGKAMRTVVMLIFFVVFSLFALGPLLANAEIIVDRHYIYLSAAIFILAIITDISRCYSNDCQSLSIRNRINSTFSYFSDAISCWLYNYGESPFQIGRSVLIIVILFGCCIYFFNYVAYTNIMISYPPDLDRLSIVIDSSIIEYCESGYKKPNFNIIADNSKTREDIDNLQREAMKQYLAPDSWLANFANSCYISLVAFTTLGFGDYRPLHWCKLYLSIEAFIGAVMIALFVFAIGRRTSRR